MSTASAIGMSSVFEARRKNTVATTATIHNATLLADETAARSGRRTSSADLTVTTKGYGATATPIQWVHQSTASPSVRTTSPSARDSPSCRCLSLLPGSDSGDLLKTHVPGPRSELVCDLHFEINKERPMHFKKSSARHTLGMLVVLMAIVAAAGTMTSAAQQPVKDGWITMKIHSTFVPEDALEGSNVD